MHEDRFTFHSYLVVHLLPNLSPEVIERTDDKLVGIQAPSLQHHQAPAGKPHAVALKRIERRSAPDVGASVFQPESKGREAPSSN